jgi:hypothetical protein
VHEHVKTINGFYHMVMLMYNVLAMAYGLIVHGKSFTTLFCYVSLEVCSGNVLRAI